jgi:hypothetical protein
MMMEAGDHWVSMLVPYHTRPFKELVVMGQIDIETWPAAQSGYENP